MVDKVGSYDMTNNITLADVLKVCSVAKRGKCPQAYRRDGYACPHYRHDRMCYEIRDFELYFKPICGDESC